jgi:hypothetical protein
VSYCMLGKTLMNCRLDYLINVFGLSTKEAQKALRGT